MDIEGYRHSTELTLEGVQYILLNFNIEPIVGNDAMWFYMTTGQVLEGQDIERTTRDTEEGINQQ